MKLRMDLKASISILLRVIMYVVNDGPECQHDILRDLSYQAAQQDARHVLALHTRNLRER